MASKKLSEFLKKIAHLESNDGKNTNHKTINHGIQAGTTAIGKYGLMPNTIKEIISNKKRSGQLTPELELLANLDQNDLKTVLEHKPELQEQLAESYAKTIMLKKMGDPDKMAYSWFNGPNSNITPQKLNKSEYVKRFRNVASVMKSPGEVSSVLPKKQAQPIESREELPPILPVMDQSNVEDPQELEKQYEKEDEIAFNQSVAEDNDVNNQNYEEIDDNDDELDEDDSVFANND